MRLAQDGFDLTLSDHHEPSLGTTLRTVQDAVPGPKAVGVPSDVTRESDIVTLMSNVETSTGRLDGLVSAAGVIDVSPVEQMPLHQWERVIAINLTGSFVVAKHADHGRVVMIASDAGKTGESGIAHYCASKFGVIGLTQSLALEFAGTRVTVNAVCPVICETPMIDSLAQDYANVSGEGDAAHRSRRFTEEIPAGRACQPDDVAAAVSFFASPEAQFITGESLNVAGGHEMH